MITAEATYLAYAFDVTPNHKAFHYCTGAELSKDKRTVAEFYSVAKKQWLKSGLKEDQQGAPRALYRYPVDAKEK